MCTILNRVLAFRKGACVMKNLQLNKVLTLVLTLAMVFTFGFSMVSTVHASEDPAPAVGEGSTSTGTGSSSGTSSSATLDSLEESAVTAISDVQKTIVEICLAAATLSIIVGIAMLIFCHNDKILGKALRVCGLVLVAVFVILFVQGGTAIEIIKDFVNNIQ